MNFEEINIMVSDENETETETCTSTTVEELLIGCVMARPPLWDSRLWRKLFEFGSNSDFSVEFLMKKWINLRDTYVRIKGDYTPSGSAAKKKKKWEYFDLMSFLSKTISFRPTITNLTSPGTSTAPSPLLSPTESSNEGEVAPKGRKVESSETAIPKLEGAILNALNKINVPTMEEPSPQINPICLRISEMLSQTPQKARTVLEIKLLQVEYKGAIEFL